MLVTPELVSPLDKNEVTEAPGDRVYQPNDPEFYLLGRIEGKLGREFRATGRARPAQPDEALSERAAVGDRPARPCRLIENDASCPRKRAKDRGEHGKASEPIVRGGRGSPRPSAWRRAAQAQAPVDPATRRPSCAHAAAPAPDVSPLGPHGCKTSSSVIPKTSSSRRWALMSTSNSPCRSPRPTRIGSRSTAVISCPEPACSRRSARRGTTSWRREFPAGWARSRSNGPPSSPSSPKRGGRRSSNTLVKAGQPVVADRVVIAPSPYPGAMGIEAANNFTNTITRTQMAAPGLRAAADRNGLERSSMT